MISRATRAWLVTCLLLTACSGGDQGKGRKNSTGVDGSVDGSVDASRPGGDGDGDGDGDVSGDGGQHSDGGRVLIPGDGGGIPFPVNDAGQVLCGTGPCQCSDGIDNDGDGRTDLADPKCVSLWDNDESSFGTGISGDNRDDACQDCFFDGNSGSGNDGCRVPTSCIAEGNPSSGRGSCNKCEQSDKCKNFCRPYTPNGCDCFGCCTVKLGSNIEKHILLESGCTLDGDQFDGCRECVPNDSCINKCGKCELCPGKTVADLPSDCFMSPGDGDGDGGDGDGDTDPPYTCDDGETRCGAGLPPCPTGSFCEFGCCVLSPIVL